MASFTSLYLYESFCVLAQDSSGYTLPTLLEYSDISPFNSCNSSTIFEYFVPTSQIRMRPPENLTTTTVDTPTTLKHSSSTVTKRKARHDDDAHIQNVSHHHQHVDELDISRPGFREVPANVTRVAAGTRSAATPPVNQPDASPHNRRLLPTRKFKKKGRSREDSESESESENTSRRGNNDGQSASRQREEESERIGTIGSAEYQQGVRQKGYDWMLKLKKAEKKYEDFYRECERNRATSLERREELSRHSSAFATDGVPQGFYFNSSFVYPTFHWMENWERLRQAHFDKILYAYIKATLGSESPMESPHILDDLKELVEAVESEVVRRLGHFDRRRKPDGVEKSGDSTNHIELICSLIDAMCLDLLEISSAQPAETSDVDILKQRLKEPHVSDRSIVGHVAGAYVDKIIASVAGDGKRLGTFHQSNKLKDKLSSKHKRPPAIYLGWICDTHYLCVRDDLRKMQRELNDSLRSSRQIRQEIFRPGDEKSDLVWSVLWSWDQPKMLEALSLGEMKQLGWFYDGKRDNFWQYKRGPAGVHDHETIDGPFFQVSMTEEIIGIYLSEGNSLTLE
ncbi:hypothetical protein K456DRAFT_1934647 [Colletotrichum gloeosporioides 23]|nr:hypothetical protein K456DRAFT_1934647 [Colletotrichum gloeosporioides 23]